MTQGTLDALKSYYNGCVYRVIDEDDFDSVILYSLLKSKWQYTVRRYKKWKYVILPFSVTMKMYHYMCKNIHIEDIHTTVINSIHDAHANESCLIVFICNVDE